MRRRFFCRSKEKDRPSDDAVAALRQQGVYALADGASSSYAGGIWARELVRHYVHVPVVELAWLDAVRRRFYARAKPDNSDWLGEIAFDKGSHSTLLGFTLQQNGINGFALGDTILFVVAPSGATRHFPQIEPKDFDDDPVLLSSHARRGAFAETEDAFEKHRFELPAPAEGWEGWRIIAMTDALALWVIRGGIETPLAELCAIATKQAFNDLIAAMIDAKEMNYDDATLLIIEP